VNVKLKYLKDSKQPVLPQEEGRVPAPGMHRWHMNGQAKTQVQALVHDQTEACANATSICMSLYADLVRTVSA